MSRKFQTEKFVTEKRVIVADSFTCHNEVVVRASGQLEFGYFSLQNSRELAFDEICKSPAPFVKTLDKASAPILSEQSATLSIASMYRSRVRRGVPLTCGVASKARCKRSKSSAFDLELPGRPATVARFRSFGERRAVTLLLEVLASVVR
jgi:hypothetical protein